MSLPPSRAFQDPVSRAGCKSPTTRPYSSGVRTRSRCPPSGIWVLSLCGSVSGGRREPPARRSAGAPVCRRGSHTIASQFSHRPLERRRQRIEPSPHGAPGDRRVQGCDGCATSRISEAREPAPAQRRGDSPGLPPDRVRPARSMQCRPLGVRCLSQPSTRREFLMYIGTAGWAIPGEAAASFPGEGRHLQRYARVLGCAEIDSSFHRSHRVETYARCHHPRRPAAPRARAA